LARIQKRLMSSTTGPQSRIKTFLTGEAGLPERFADAFLEKLGADTAMTMRAIKKADLNRLIHELMHHELPVTGDMGYKKAEVTAGGVDLKEVDYATMASKLVPGLYFAGEILDVDGRIGGFNFQWAWSSGTVAGKSAAKGKGA
jgi:predicted Rossmann fold flavoprotein